MKAKSKTLLKGMLPTPVYRLCRLMADWRGMLRAGGFIFNGKLGISLRERLRLVRRLYVISLKVESPHTQEEILNYVEHIIAATRNGEGCIVEAGCYKGSSTAKFSLAADLVGKELVVFDGFQGIPENNEVHGRTIFGDSASFKKGDWCGGLEEVKANVAKYGKIDRCRFVPGWFEDTMPGFKEPISAIYLDVDLASSTRTCVKFLYPHLMRGGALYSQDGHLPLVIEVLDDDNFWRSELAREKPKMEGLRTSKLIKITKDV